MRRVAITGLGTVNPLGIGVAETWRRMLAGENGVGPNPHFDTSEYSVRIGAFVDWEVEQHFSRPDQRKLDPFTMWALMSADEALADAGLPGLAEEDEERRYRYGAIIGTGIGGITGIEEQHHVLLAKGAGRVSPHFIPRIMANAVAGQVSIRNGLMGTSFTTSSACASSGHAMGMAWQSIRHGESDLVLTGGAESATTTLGLAGFCSAKALSTRNDDPKAASRPFDRDRDGFVMGEGAAVLVFEEWERARARDARIYAEVVGFGSTDDAFHITAPREDGKGPARAMRLALAAGAVDPESVDYVNAHGTSTHYNDMIETRALRTVFAAHADALAVSSTKSMLGHLMGASSAVELLATALSVHHGQVHPTRNYTTPDPECDLDYVPGEAREVPLRHALSNSLGFGGHNVSICLRRAE
ncbi:MAG: beta-ketoacyl-[acyl-carrier-protein] synthase II [Planctomycetes bacterium]|nr:beta-ketoacyl-[acyl-carrier-protein] synthase II [Planctomycetota bacterium]MDP6410568.1 beta-ketoacyl-ACP synthase II [Planctomycetota bacterium]